MNKADALKTAAFLARSIDLHKRLNNLIGVVEPKNGRIYYTEQAVAHIRELVARVDEQDKMLRELLTMPVFRVIENHKARIEAQDALLQQAHEALTHHQDQTRPIFKTQHAIAAIEQYRKKNQ